ncbi:MAG: hypothetical protein LBI72_07585, partial [Flavobacteriaceae bacterium]|nr:hypothetical protein [Flavobacteriaceae bacterium]
MSKGKQLAVDFKLTEWKTPDVYNQLRALMKDEEEISAFCLEFLTNNTKSSTLFDSALSYISEEHFAELVKTAITLLQQQESKLAESVIEYASIQLPHILHPYTEELLELNPNGESYYADYYWRYLPTAQLQPYLERFLAV